VLFSPPHYLSSSHTPVFFSFLFRSLPWTFSCIRSYIVVPDTRLARKYVLIYDMVITQPHFRNHVLLQVFSGQGFFNSEFFTIMLIDIVTINEKLVTIMSAVVLHGNALAMVFYMFCTITVIFAAFGVRYFADAFSTSYTDFNDDDEGSGVPTTSRVAFRSALSAFWFMFYNMVQRGNLKATLAPTEPKQEGWLPRLLFDTTFFICIGIILFTTITALLVDALAKSRQISESRAHAAENQCFVCGLTRQEYDKSGLSTTDLNGQRPRSWKDHMHEDHDVWTYVAYAAYLQHKMKAGKVLTGIEAFVTKQIKDKSPWIPMRTSVHLEELARIQQEEALEMSGGNGSGENSDASGSKSGADAGGGGGGGGDARGAGGGDGGDEEGGGVGLMDDDTMQKMIDAISKKLEMTVVAAIVGMKEG
jgi:uncharacterized membrane protein YgcG